LTDEAVALLPGLTQSFTRMGELIEQVRSGVSRKPLTVGVVNTFAIGWLLPRLEIFQAEHPLIELRVRTHNNKVNLLADGLDCAIQFGDDNWPDVDATRIAGGALSPLCSPRLASQLHRPADVLRFDLLRSYRADEWPRWFAEAGVETPATRGPVFDSSLAMVLAAERSLGIALAPPSMFAVELESRRVVQPFSIAVDAGSYFLTRPKNRPPAEPVEAFIAWCSRMALSEAIWS
jgi:LysR family transcriptional regulator of beta-lactamase